jgi:hypothetical protein
MYQSTEKIFKRSLLLFALAFFSCGLFAQNANTGIFQTYVIVDVNNTSNQYLAGGINSDLATQFNGINFGTVSSFVLNGGEVKTYKNGPGDVFGAEIYYRVYPQSGTPGSFAPINLPFFQNLPTPGDQVWQQALAGVDLLAGTTASTTYVLEVFWKVTTNQGDLFDSNFSNNFTATFTTQAAPPPSVPTMSEWGLILFALLVLSVGAAALHRRQQAIAAA